ncbi:urease accessory protein [Deinococcus metalli]|uniref:Urease accessory protein UreF n=1 Tax=Deinococcus metalli TaxID=1141878 RepID=A0A7W8KCK1_9DEIO|nr:urease accessory UreF family protein [Deinococcus metalli]MBB5375707.1 urease accessory protein [Deinococcus metalli]GHF37635.1 urease accessory protein UreF [Deinococcus metalli]
MNLLRLLQLSDSAFPTGAYAFSDGLETLTAHGAVRSPADLRAFLAGQLTHGWGAQDVPACALAWRADAAALADLDALLDDLKLVPGPRGASVRVGANLRRAAAHLWPEVVAAVPVTRHHATTFGALAAALDVPRAETVTAFVSGWLLGRATSATRLMRVGGLDAQGCAAACEDAARACIHAALHATPDDLATFTPLLDLAASEQPMLDARLFQT